MTNFLMDALAVVNSCVAFLIILLCSLVGGSMGYVFYEGGSQHDQVIGALIGAVIGLFVGAGSAAISCGLIAYIISIHNQLVAIRMLLMR